MIKSKHTHKAKKNVIEPAERLLKWQRGTADVTGTGDTMDKFLQPAESVFEETHTDMAELRDEFDRDENDE